MRHFDIAIVGAAILGLAHALAAARRGQRVVVLERDAQANGASIRNFGFVTVTGQEAGDCWRLARRSRDIWAEVVASAQIPVLHSGLVVAARRPDPRFGRFQPGKRFHGGAGRGGRRARGDPFR